MRGGFFLLASASFTRSPLASPPGGVISMSSTVRRSSAARSSCSSCSGKTLERPNESEHVHVTFVGAHVGGSTSASCGLPLPVASSSGAASRWTAPSEPTCSPAGRSGSGASLVAEMLAAELLAAELELPSSIARSLELAPTLWRRACDARAPTGRCTGRRSSSELSPALRQQVCSRLDRSRLSGLRLRPDRSRVSRLRTRPVRTRLSGKPRRSRICLRPDRSRVSRLRTRFLAAIAGGSATERAHSSPSERPAGGREKKEWGRRPPRREERLRREMGERRTAESKLWRVAWSVRPQRTLAPWVVVRASSSSFLLEAQL